jgi:hypothetical protein
MAGYAFDFQGQAFTPDGRTDVPNTDTHNREVEAKEVAWLKTHPERAFLYVKRGHGTDANGDQTDGNVTIWTGIVVGPCWIGPRVKAGFGYHTYRCAITARVFGVLYHGWYFESSGDYCWLKRAKRQLVRRP